MAYGVLYGSSGDSRWHECGHGTAFKTQWKNDVVYHIACFMMLRNPVTWRWSHTRHHTDTIVVGRDPEIAVMRPPRLARIILQRLRPRRFSTRHLGDAEARDGRLTPDEADYVPESERHKVYRVARVWTLIFATTILASILMARSCPSCSSACRACMALAPHLTGVTQHAGLAEDVLDHRLNCRTVYMNPISRFVYWNMNYHVEHHMFPMVPYHRLPELHEEMKADCPEPYPSMWAAYKEIIPAIWRQLRDTSHFVRRELPPTAAAAE